MADYDVVVIGAGPGGGAAAHFLASSGLKVAVLERKHFPRAKTCGDGLTPRSIKILDDLGMAEEISTYTRVRGLRVKGAGRTLHLDFPRLSKFCDWGVVRPRKNLDLEIAEGARRAGATLLMGREAVSPIWEGKRLAGVRWVSKEKAEDGGVVKADEGTITSNFTIISDGASSPFGRALGFKKYPDYPMGLAIRTYYESPMTRDEYFESWLTLRKEGVSLPGYGWIFPVGDGTVNVGVGLLNSFGRWREVNLNNLQRDFVGMLPREYGITHESQTEKYQSGRLPMGASVAEPYGNGYLLIGDAAGMVNPFNGEGIAYALETAKIAAALVASVTADGRSTDLSSYRELLHDTYGAYYRLGRKFVKLIGRPAWFQALVGVGMRSRTLMEFVLQVLANLSEETGGRLSDRGFRRLLAVAEFDLPELENPDIPLPKGFVDKQKAGAA